MSQPTPQQQSGQGQSGSNQDGNNTGAATSGAGDQQGTQQTITMTSQQLADRLARAKPADYDDLKAKATRLEQLEAANKSDLEKATDRATKAEQDRDAARAEALRFKVAAAHGISTAPAKDGGPSDAELFLTASDEATLTKQAERLLGRDTDRKRQGNVAPREGVTTNSGGTDQLRSFTRNLFHRD